MVVGESRTELLQWLNSTLGLAYSKVEQCGTGAAYCQILDSIYEDVPMGRVKFDATSEYESLNNMKILQAGFSKHKITKKIEVEKLVKCRLQDNLELLQWFKKYWMENMNINNEYNAQARRKQPALRRTSGMSSPVVTGSRASSSSSRTNARRVSSGNASIGLSAPAIGSNPKVAQLSQKLDEANDRINTLTYELDEYKISVNSLETERNFYFNKLREIEITSENLKEQISSGAPSASLEEFIEQVQTILYSTEEGFQVNDAQELEQISETLDAESF